MDIIPAGIPDQHLPLPRIRTRSFFIVRDRLDGDALRAALDTLIRQHWRKLGARVVCNKDGLYEYHLPHVFADDYELFKWSSQEYSGCIDDAAALLKAPTAEGLSILPSIKEVDSIWRPDSWPFGFLDDPPNSPILYIHVNYYEDATVLAVSMPHLFGDQMGMASLLKAWLGILDGKTPPPFIEDGLPNEKAYADYAHNERRQRGKQHIRYWMEYFFVLLAFLPSLILQPKEEYAMFFFPRQMIQKLRDRASKELEEKHGSSPGISDGDIISAIMTKFSRMEKKRSRTLTLSQTVNLRGRVPKLISSPVRDGFLHNALVTASSRFRITPKTPMSEIAYSNRKAIEDLLAPGGPDLALAVIREMVRVRQTMHVCEIMDTSYSITSWSAIWRSLDFSSAVVKNEKTTAERKVPELMVLGESGEPTTPRRYHTTIMFRNDKGYYCDVGFTPRTMKAIKAYLAMDPELAKF